MLIVACCHSKCCLLSVLERWRLAAPFYVIVCLSFTLRVSTYVHGSSFMVKCGNNWKSTHPLIGNHARCSTLMGTLSWDYDTQLWVGKSYNSYVCVSIQSHADVKVTLEGTKPIGWGPKQLQPCICVNDKGTTVIGASLSEPNTSGTALHKCVCICACLWPYIVNFKRAFKYFSKILCPHARWRTMQGYCQSAASASQSEDGSSWSMHGSLLLVSLSSYGPTINGRLLADRTNLGAGLRSLQVRALHKKGTHRHQRSAHDFTVKLSLSMCGHSSCLGWRNVTACDLTSTQFGL